MLSFTSILHLWNTRNVSLTASGVSQKILKKKKKKRKSLKFHTKSYDFMIYAKHLKGRYRGTPLIRSSRIRFPAYSISGIQSQQRIYRQLSLNELGDGDSHKAIQMLERGLVLTEVQK